MTESTAIATDAAAGQTLAPRPLGWQFPTAAAMLVAWNVFLAWMAFAG